jgi:hypothetical protein
VQLEHLGAAFAHLEHEIVMIFLRLLHPENVVEQEIARVARCQALVREPRTADEHRAQLADFAVNPEFLHCLPSLIHSGSATARKNAVASASGSPNHFVYNVRNSGVP